MKRWTSTGQLKRLNELKRVVVEPRKSRATKKEMKEFTDTVSRTSKGEENDTLFLAVCRGKLSEGIDFPGSAARAVILVGIPYPSTKDLRVKLQREYQDSCKKSRFGQEIKPLSGREWYQQQAFRALNQAAGRCIRHRKDWGSVIFLDSRYGNNNAMRSLPRWLRPHVKKFRAVGEMCETLREFVSRNTAREKEEEETKIIIEKRKKEEEEKAVVSKEPKETTTKASSLLDMFRREEEKEQEKRREKIRFICSKCKRVLVHVKERTSRVTTNSIMCRLNENKDFVAVNRLMLEDNVFAPALRRDIGEMYHWWDDRDKRAYRLLCCASCHPSGSCEDAIAAEVIGIGRRDDQTLNEIWIFTSRVGVLRWGERATKNIFSERDENVMTTKKKKRKKKKKKKKMDGTKRKKREEEENNTKEDTKDMLLSFVNNDDSDDDFEPIVRRKKKKKKEPMMSAESGMRM